MRLVHGPYFCDGQTRCVYIYIVFFVFYIYVCVELVAEDKTPGDEDKCDRLNVTMRSSRHAALDWQQHLRE